ncbi:MAG: hypothetical protein KC489_04335 [Gemmatimonadetes bacterium]|nr:hypothetical protein [Gemmatimonadota bacterium]
MRQIGAGLAILAAWGVLTFGIQPATGWIHVLLIAGVLLVIRGIAGREPGEAA